MNMNMYIWMVCPVWERWSGRELPKWESVEAGWLAGWLSWVFVSLFVCLMMLMFVAL
jgi:hypothetical protein